MSSIERKTVYFQASGKQNTESVLELVKDSAQAEGIRDIVVASTTGETGMGPRFLQRPTPLAAWRGPSERSLKPSCPLKS